MKKYFLLLAYLLTSVWCWAFSGQGSGTMSDPFLVTNADELFEVRYNLTAYYKQMNDIDLTEWIAEESPSQGWSPIGSLNSPFCGHYDGNSKTIKGLYINRTSVDNIGLFGFVKGATLQNITLLNPHVKGQNHVGSIVGGVDASQAAYTIKGNTCVMGAVEGNEAVGGIMGGSVVVNDATYNDTNEKKVIGNYSSATIIGNESVGGIVGLIHGHYYYDQITTYYATAIVRNNRFGGKVRSASRYFCGGIVGNSERHNKKSSRSYNFVQFTNNIVGGSIISNNNTNDGYVGGVAGYAQYVTNGMPSSIKNNVCVADTISCLAGTPYRIYHESNTYLSTSDNIALASTVMIANGVEIEVEDGELNGTSVSRRLLMKQSTYEGMGFDFNSTWAISEGESYPYNINQSAPVTITKCTCGQYAKINGTAKADGTIYVFVGRQMFEGTITNGQWEVAIGQVAEGTEVRVSTRSSGKMPSPMTTTKAEAMPEVFTFSITAGTDGSVIFGDATVTGTQTFNVEEGSTATLTIAPDEGYQLKSLMVNGADVTSEVVNNTYTLVNISGNTTVNATFEQSPAVVTFKSSAGGSVTCMGVTVTNGTKKVEVEKGTNVKLTFSPNTGYKLTKVTLNGTNITSKVKNNAYTISKIAADATVVATYEEIPIYLTIQHADNGCVAIEVERGKSYRTAIQAADGWEINTVTLDGEDVTSELDVLGIYTTPAMSESSVLNVSFMKATPTQAKPIMSNIMKVRGHEGVLYVSCVAEGERIAVYNQEGKLMTVGISNGSEWSTCLPKGVVYVVKAEGNTVKIMM